MISVRVPATTANLGPGFDCLGAALNLYARFEFSLMPEGLDISGCAAEDQGQDNLVYRAYCRALSARGLSPGGLRLRIQSDIPVARGLGSSAACVVGGILGASALHGLNLDKDAVFALAARMEGHPDNAAPAVYGGLRLSITAEGTAHSLPLQMADSLRFLALVPDFALPTYKARAALAPLVSREDAVYNLSRTAFLIQALALGDPALIALGCQDRLHQEARFDLIPGARALKALAERAGAIAVCLSGAGPTLLCLYVNKAFPHALQKALGREYPGLTTLPLNLCETGASVERKNDP